MSVVEQRRKVQAAIHFSQILFFVPLFCILGEKIDIYTASCGRN